MRVVLSIALSAAVASALPLQGELIKPQVDNFSLLETGVELVPSLVQTKTKAKHHKGGPDYDAHRHDWGENEVDTIDRSTGTWSNGPSNGDPKGQTAYVRWMSNMMWEGGVPGKVGQKAWKKQFESQGDAKDWVYKMTGANQPFDYEAADEDAHDGSSKRNVAEQQNDEGKLEKPIIEHLTDDRQMWRDERLWKKQAEEARQAEAEMGEQVV